MMRGVYTFLTFVSAALFPWPLTAFLALALSFSEPLLPLAAGLFVDVLYYAPHAQALPLFTLSGALATVSAFLVRSRLKASIIGE